MMKKIFDYKIFSARDVDKLRQTVMFSIIEEDWEPIGGIAVNPNTGEFYQAMVIYRNAKEKS